MCSIKGKHIRIKWAIVWLLFTCKIYFVHIMSEQSGSMWEECASDLALSVRGEDTKMLPLPQLSFKHSHPHPAQTGPIHPVRGAIAMLWSTELCPAPGSMELPLTREILMALHQSSNRKSSYWKSFPVSVQPQPGPFRPNTMPCQLPFSRKQRNMRLSLFK